MQILEDHRSKIADKSKPILKIPIKHSIHLKDNTPVFLPARPLPYSERKEVLEQVENLTHEGIIALSTSFYGTPIVTVRKADGTFRL